ncbi:hypothetical protein [Streptomyces avermitilis]|uniref:hypothetical protein n=1 Tax=Streptomyces avermitilis TaxID=33903 RepID=UPI0036C54B49
MLTNRPGQHGLTGGSDHDAVGNLRLIARTTPLPTAVRHDLASNGVLPSPIAPGTDPASAAAGAPRGELEFRPVQPDLVA